MNQAHHLQGSKRTKERDLDDMVGEEKTQAFEIGDEQFFDDVWHLRKEYQIASQALRKRSQDSEKNTPSIVDQEEEADMKSTVKVSGARRPALIHRQTDPFPMREFSRNIDWKCEEKKMQEIEEKIQSNERQTVCEEHEINSDSNSNIKKSILNDERFLISSYDLAKRRLSLPLSTIERSWNCEERTSSQDLDDTEHTVSSTLTKSCHRSSLKQMDYSAMERRRRHSAWTKRQSSLNTSFNSEMNKPLRKRRMSELPALSTIATTRRRSVPHTLSIPVGLRRKGSKAGLTSDFQNLSSSCTRAKNEMLATLSMSSWLDKLPSRQYENPRRKSCHTGFGVMALKKKEEKRLMVAHEILQTEKNYIKALETLNEVFVEPLKNACVIPEKDMRTMFPKQLHAMKNGHVQFMNELDERLNNWKWQGALGDIFAKLGNSYHIDFLTLYSEYVNNFPKSIAVINKHSRNSQKFRKLIEKCGNDPRCERLNISAFLLTPIQRLPRYVLLLRQLAKYTDCNHPDSFHIEISLEKMIDIINLLNSSIQNSTSIARNTSLRRSSRRSRRKKPMFKPKEIVNSELTSPRKSSDDSDLSEASSPSTPCAKDLSPLTLDSLSSDQQSKSSDYGSLTNSEAASEPTSPSPLSFSGSSSKSNFLKVILRTNSNSDSKKSKRKRPLSTTEVEIIRRENEHLSNGIPKHDELTRSTSRDSFGSVIRQKFGSFRRKPSQRSSDESLSRNLSLERLNECRQALFKYHRNSHDDDSLREEDNEQTTCIKSENNLLEEKHKLTVPLHSGSSMESCNGSREHLYVSCAHGHSDSDDDSRLKSLDCTHDSRLKCDGIESNYSQKHDHQNNCDETRTYLNHKTSLTSDENLGHRKLYKRNSFTNAVKHFFVSKTRSSSSSPETVQHSETPESINTEQIFNSRTSKAKITTV